MSVSRSGSVSKHRIPSLDGEAEHDKDGDDDHEEDRNRKVALVFNIDESTSALEYPCLCPEPAPPPVFLQLDFPNYKIITYKKL